MWGEIDRKAAAMCVRSETDAMSDIEVHIGNIRTDLSGAGPSEREAVESTEMVLAVVLAIARLCEAHAEVRVRSKHKVCFYPLEAEEAEEEVS